MITILEQSCKMPSCDYLKKQKVRSQSRATGERLKMNQSTKLASEAIVVSYDDGKILCYVQQP